MKEFDEILVETLYNRAESEQNVANRLYEGRSSDESYYIAAVTAQVLRNVAGALEQAKNIDSENPRPDTMKSMREVYAPERAVDPDIFRDALDQLVDYLIEEGFTSKAHNVLENCIMLLRKYPLSPARQVQAKYERLLKECLEVFRNIQILTSFEAGFGDFTRSEYDNFIENLEDILE